jgi:Leucine-rich repeat (LRR) protein
LKELPEKIGELINLKILVLNSNRLKTLPSSLIKLTKLEVLDLSVNRDLDVIVELDKISKLPNLKVLKIVDVKLRKSDIDLLKKSLHTDTKVILTVQEYFELDSKKMQEIQDSIANNIKEINEEILKNRPQKIKKIK